MFLGKLFKKSSSSSQRPAIGITQPATHMQPDLTLILVPTFYRDKNYNFIVLYCHYFFFLLRKPPESPETHSVHVLQLIETPGLSWKLYAMFLHSAQHSDGRQWRCFQSSHWRLRFYTIVTRQWCSEKANYGQPTSTSQTCIGNTVVKSIVGCCHSGI